MELKWVYSVQNNPATNSFNRTAYGIEIRFNKSGDTGEITF